ncbi:MAG: PmoA family protein [Planctomycetota bacterium]|nr:MAG: PmoA family protein [Planctomycetota bacterium]
MTSTTQLMFMNRAACRILVSVFITLLLAGCSIPDGGKAFRVEKDEASVCFYAGNSPEGGKPLVRYRYADVPFKSYVQEFRTPWGVNILRDSPHDHKHHHALMLGLTVDEVNFWAEEKNCGKQVHREFADWIQDTQKGLQRAAVTDVVDWINPADKKSVIHEYRTIETYRAKILGASLLTWNSQFELPADKSSASITGVRYYGLGVRFVQSMDVGGDFINADGKTGVEGTNKDRSSWCAYKALADGKPVTVAVFDYPKNVRHPATWFTMTENFAYISATLDLPKNPVEVSAAEPLRLRYGLAVWDGHVESETIDKLYKRWIELPTTNPSK